MAITSVRQAGLTGFTKYRSLADASGNPEMPFPGYVLLTPTSIAHSGTSASIGANGQVTFTAVTSLSLNGVFSADFDNYVVSIRATNTVGVDVKYRWRASGSDNSTASSYVDQRLLADGGVTANRFTDNIGLSAIAPRSTQRAGSSWLIYGPFLAQPTANRTISTSDYLSSQIYETAGTHNQSTSYDGFTLSVTSGNFTGALQVYGVRS